MPTHRGGEHIQRLVERLHAYSKITLESLHCQLNEVFQFPCPIFINCVSKDIQSQARFTLKLSRCELDDYNNENVLEDV